jgi:hypothetical protein
LYYRLVAAPVISVHEATSTDEFNKKINRPQLVGRNKRSVIRQLQWIEMAGYAFG